MTRIRRVASATLTALLLLTTAETLSAQSRNWWICRPELDHAQIGDLEELLGRKKVYVNVTLTDAQSNLELNTTERNDIAETVKKAIASHKGLILVTYPEEAEFAVLVRITTEPGLGPNFSLVLDSETEVGIDLLVLVPGTRRRDGTRVPRIAWEAYSPNTQTEARSATRFMVDSFLWELKKIQKKGKKKKESGAIGSSPKTRSDLSTEFLTTP